MKFYLGQMRTKARETAFQRALRNCSKEVMGKVSIYMILVKGATCNQVHIFLQKVSASLMKLTASHKEQMSP